MIVDPGPSSIQLPFTKEMPLVSTYRDIHPEITVTAEITFYRQLFSSTGGLFRGGTCIFAVVNKG